MPSAAILGASGYAGGELIRFLDAHPSFDVAYLGAHTAAGASLAGVHPHLGAGDRVLGSLDPDAVPDVEAARRAVADLLARPAAPGRHRIVATGHAHIDTAWLWPVRETVRKCVRTFSSAVRLLDEDPDFVFSCSQAQQYAWIEEHHPELFTEIVAAVERGQWEPVGGMWVEADTNVSGGESLIRQFIHDL